MGSTSEQKTAKIGEFDKILAQPENRIRSDSMRDLCLIIINNVNKRSIIRSNRSNLVDLNMINHVKISDMDRVEIR